MRFTKRQHLASVEVVCQADTFNGEPVELDITLSHLLADTKPTVFGLYIWNLPLKNTEAILRAAVEEYTGLKVKTLSMQAGNGHGRVTVEYDD